MPKENVNSQYPKPQNWKQANHPPKNGYTKYSVHKEYYSAINQKENQIHATTWVHLVDIMLWEIR